MVVINGLLAPLFGLLMLIGLTAPASSAPFRTRQEVFWFGTALTNSAIIKQERADQCHVAGEELPAELNADGNWGLASDGFQLSIRFEKPVYLAGEPVIASLIVRNASGGMLADSIALPDKTEFVVANEKDDQLKRIDIFRQNATEQEERRRAFMKSFSLQLAADEQWKYKMVLTDMFDLKRPGTYYIKAVRRVWKPDGDAGEIVSGKASIRIIDGHAASGSIPAGAVPPPTPGLDSSQTSRILATPAARSAERPVEVKGTGTNALLAPPTTYISEQVPEPASSPSQKEAGGSRLGAVSGTVRIGGSVLVILLGSAAVFFVLRHARRRAGG